MDDTIRTTEQITQILKLPVWGMIRRFGKRGDSYQQRLITNNRVEAVVVESYRSFKTNLVIEHDDKNKVYVVTSPGPREGKSLTAANLAVVLAQSGLQVLLIDADLRRPKLHEVFGLPNETGLTTLLFADPAKTEKGLVNQALEEDLMSLNSHKAYVQQTNVRNLHVIPSGPIPMNPVDLLGSPLMRRYIDAFRELSFLNVIILDTPPALAVADTCLLSATVKAKVLLVVDSARTRRVAAQKTIEKFAQFGLSIKGVVLNRAHPRDEDYGYGYGYADYYTHAKLSVAHSPNGKSDTKVRVKQK